MTCSHGTSNRWSRQTVTAQHPRTIDKPECFIGLAHRYWKAIRDVFGKPFVVQLNDAGASAGEVGKAAKGNEQAGLVALVLDDKNDDMLGLGPCGVLRD